MVSTSRRPSHWPTSRGILARVAATFTAAAVCAGLAGLAAVPALVSTATTQAAEQNMQTNWNWGV
ncbi:hypothetical protein [Pseudonocardia acidicola]|uniref:Endoglucanase n=1 Tax=Pseudonocardia acidicola TaxID=2724939 RepID=A0ABX1SAW0_9PSEU|nr:hypothetical protein [Pseudonocardia acidicola]NMH98694.1 hypothetical protein [Pseudonocardia acidicola]